MLMWIYRLIALYIIIMLGVTVIKSEKWNDQLVAGLVLIPLILRILLIR